MVTLHYYGCVKCQHFHYQELTPNLYKKHLDFQSKNGTGEIPFQDESFKNAFIAGLQRHSFEDVPD